MMMSKRALAGLLAVVLAAALFGAASAFSAGDALRGAATDAGSGFGGAGGDGGAGAMMAAGASGVGVGGAGVDAAGAVTVAGSAGAAGVGVGFGGDGVGAAGQLGPGTDLGAVERALHAHMETLSRMGFASMDGERYHRLSDECRTALTYALSTRDLDFSGAPQLHTDVLLVEGVCASAMESAQLIDAGVAPAYLSRPVVFPPPPVRFPRLPLTTEGLTEVEAEVYSHIRALGLLGGRPADQRLIAGMSLCYDAIAYTDGIDHDMLEAAPHLYADVLTIQYLCAATAEGAAAVRAGIAPPAAAPYPPAPPGFVPTPTPTAGSGGLEPVEIVLYDHMRRIERSGFEFRVEGVERYEKVHELCREAHPFARGIDRSTLEHIPHLYTDTLLVELTCVAAARRVTLINAAPAAALRFAGRIAQAMNLYAGSADRAARVNAVCREALPFFRAANIRQAYGADRSAELSVMVACDAAARELGGGVVSPPTATPTATPTRVPVVVGTATATATATRVPGLGTPTATATATRVPAAECQYQEYAPAGSPRNTPLIKARAHPRSAELYYYTPEYPLYGGITTWDALYCMESDAVAAGYQKHPGHPAATATPTATATGTATVQ